uniref:WW domain-containing protein n=1 Tax=Arundo donax TaxID=35708 RepID=A0A0A9HZJ3_ARUDO
MAEMVSSALIGETVNRIMSNLTGKDEEKSWGRENIERLEMAHIKMEAMLQISNKWQITHMPLLRWRSKLKRAAQECDNTLRRCKQRAVEEEEIRLRVSQSSFPNRIAHATKSLISSFVGYINDESSNSSANVRRFERYANGASEFLKSVEFGGTPRKYTFFIPLIGHLLTGKSLRYEAYLQDKLYFLSIRPVSSADRGVEAMMGFVCQDFKVPTKGFYVACMLRLSESTDIFGIMIKCIQSVAPHLKFAAEGVKRGLIQLPTQDFTWVPYSPYGANEFWVNVHSTLTQWYRPNPLCCNEHKRYLTLSSCSGNTVASSSKLLLNIFPEEVIKVLLKWNVLLSDQHTKSTISTAEHGGSSPQNADMPALNLGVLFIPHESPEDIEPAAESYALEVIDGEEQGMIHTNAHLQDLGERFLPKAIDYLCQNSESRMYQMSLKSRHGTAHLSMEKASVQVQRGRRVKTKATRHARNRRAIQQLDIERWKQVSKDLVKLYVVRASDKHKLQGTVTSWR